MSVDPLAEKYPNESPYLYAGNNPVFNIDVGFKLPASLVEKYPAFAKYLKNNISEVLKSDAIMSSLQKNGGFNRETIKNDLQWENGPIIDIRKMSSENLTVFGHYDGKQKNGEFQIALDSDMLNRFENAFKNGKLSDEIKEASLMGVVSTLLHEYTNYGTGGADFESQEMGYKFEEDAYGTNLEPDDIGQLMQVRKLKTTGKLISPYNNRVLEIQPDKIDKSVIPTLPEKN